MEDTVNNEIDRESLEPGDHISAYRLLGIYTPHGIFIGGDRVIHYNKTREADKWKRRAKPCRTCRPDRNHFQGVVKSCVDCFLQGQALHRFQYGTCTTGRANPPEVAIHHANDYFNKIDGHGFGDYHLFENNCEAFAVLCKTKEAVSGQACAAILVLNANVEIERDALLHDAEVYYSQENHDELKHLTDSALASISSLKEFIANLQNDQAADSGEGSSRTGA